MEKKIIILNGPSGSGKTTIGNELKKLGIPELVSHTTRPMREGEIDGVSYYFVSPEIFNKIEKVEYSSYSNNHYCLSKEEVDSQLRDHNVVFAITDIDGYNQVKDKYGDMVTSIYIKVTYDEMIRRMKSRGDSNENIAKRISNAILTGEMDNEKVCDYALRNDTFSQAMFDLSIILNKEGVDIYG